MTETMIGRIGAMLRRAKQMAAPFAASVLILMFAGDAPAQSIAKEIVPLTAGAEPATGQIPGTKYYESTVLKSCNSASSCLFKFAFVPAGLLLRASNISCFVNIQLTGTEFTVMQLIQGPVANAVFKDFFPVAALGPQTVSPAFVMNQQILAFFKAGT